LKYNPEYILITHLHPDHAYFVRHHEKPSISVPMYAPEKYDNAQIDVMHKLFKIKNYKITPIPTVHSIKVKSNAYLIEHEKKKIIVYR
jgi:glyoxylase-like metal-dependent hydrolase (beta-lactamase superfamily II)